jgi:formylglycine-generating enzyme required for sulfatase activity
MRLREIGIFAFLVCAVFATSCYILDWKDDASSAYGKDGETEDGEDTIDEYGITWLFVEGGDLDMGCSLEESSCPPEELPVHSIWVSSFRMGESEITIAEWLDVIGELPAGYPDDFSCSEDECPITNITWDEASAFCHQVGDRLPTEAEWEYAARAGTTTPYYCGELEACLENVAWYQGNSGEVSHPIGDLIPNEFGFFDMLGNVSEWVNDWYSPMYYDESPNEEPAGLLFNGMFKIMRGGNRGSTYWDLRAGARNTLRPFDLADYIGFRCVKDAQEIEDVGEGVDAYTWKNYIQGYFANYCMQCHGDPLEQGATFQLLNYSDVNSRLSTIKTQTVDSEDMPPGEPLPQSYEREAVGEWIDAGAPET